MEFTSKNIMVIAGEASGDLHGADLLKELSVLDSDISFFGIGGDKMKAEGQIADYHINQMAFLGFVEVIRHIPFIRKVQKTLIERIKTENIKDVILIDYPGFNLNFAKKIKKLGVRIIYYISPQIWAWKENRIKKIQRLVDKMLVLFPFEKEYYSKHNVNCDYVGHPLSEQIGTFNFLEKDELFNKLNLDNSKEILLFLPGSRMQEIENLFSNCLPAAEKLCTKHNLQLIVACSQNIEESRFDEYKNDYKFKVIKDHTYDLYKHSKFGIIKSGTSTLEAGFIQLPFLIVYSTNWLTYQIGKMLIKIDSIGLVNIVAENKIVKELIQNDVNTDKIFNSVDEYLSDEKKYSELKNKLSIIQEKLGKEEASKNAASIIYSEINVDKKS